jgi:hypothetical protein
VGGHYLWVGAGENRVKGGKILAHKVEGGQHLNAQSQGGTTFECTKLRVEAKFECTQLTRGQHLSAKKLRLCMLYMHIYINVISIFYFLVKGGQHFST